MHQKNRILISIILLMAVVLLGCLKDDSLIDRDENSQSGSIITDEDYKIYAHIIRSLFLRPEKPHIVLLDSTITMTDEKKSNTIFISERFSKMHPEIDHQNILQHYFQVNQMRGQIQVEELPLSQTRSAISNSEIQNMFAGGILASLEGDDGWEQFYQHYADSNGYVSFSKVGFDYPNHLALVYVEQNSGWKNASGRWVILTHDNGQWQILSHHIQWIS